MVGDISTYKNKMTPNYRADNSDIVYFLNISFTARDQLENFN